MITLEMMPLLMFAGLVLFMLVGFRHAAQHPVGDAEEQRAMFGERRDHGGTLAGVQVAATVSDAGCAGRAETLK